MQMRGSTKANKYTKLSAWVWGKCDFLATRSKFGLSYWAHFSCLLLIERLQLQTTLCAREASDCLDPWRPKRKEFFSISFFSIYPVISALSPKTPLRSQKVAKVSHWPKSIGHSRLANFLIKLKDPNARITVILICIRSSMIFAILFWNWAEWSNILVV